MRVRVWVLVGAAAVRLIAAPGAPVCVSCCPVSGGAETSISALGCCDNGCGEKVARGGSDRLCLTSAQRAALWNDGVLPAGGSAPALTIASNSFRLSLSSQESPPQTRSSQLRL